MHNYHYGASGDYIKDREKFLKQGFPGFKVCMKMLQSNDPQKKEDGSYLLESHASEFLEELMTQFKRAENYGIRYWLIYLISKAKSQAAIPFLKEYLFCNEESLRRAAIQGLKDLDTKETRTQSRP
jgi:ribulose 1,5-bisphosphate carboxylase large subunit-like protein